MAKIPNELGVYQIAQNEFRPIGLRTRAINVLARRGICTLDAVGALTWQELRNIPGIGERAISQLQPFLRGESDAVARQEQAGFIRVKLGSETLTSLDDWRLKQEPMPTSRSEAIRRLVELGLKANARRR